jgi:superfamily II DNA or RNA helicase
MEKVTIARNAVTAMLHKPSRDVKLEVQAILSYAVAGAEHAIAFKKGVWDGRSSFLDFRNGTFPAGFTHYVTAHLRRKGYEVQIAQKALPEPLGPENPVVDAFPEDPRYDYQMETVRRLVKHGQIIAQIATGGGKSRTARLAYARINRMTLFITTRSILMYQMKDSFERDLGVPVSVLGDGQFGHTTSDGRQAVRKMCVGMVQTLAAKLKEKTVEGEVEAVIDALVARELKAVKALEKKLVDAGATPAQVRARVRQLEEQQLAARSDSKKIQADCAVKVHEHMAMRARVIELLGRFEFVIIEEAHEASAEDFYNVMQHCKSAHYRMALTATPFMKADEEANMRLMAVSGPIAIKVSEQTLIDRGILAQPHFRFIPWAGKPPKLFKHTGWASAYRLGITEHEWRNQTATAVCRRFAEYGLTSMVLVQHTAHGETVRRLMLAAGLRVDFIQGEDDQDGRKAALQRLARGELDILIGTTILDVGVDVPAVGHICLLGGGKAEVQLRQRIGRGLREKKNGMPNLCFVTDFADTLNEHLHNHARQRQAIIRDTPGFDRFILSDGRDFDLEALGFRRLAAAA